MITLEIMDAREYSLPLEGNLCFILILVVYFVNILAGTEVIKRYSMVVSDISGAFYSIVVSTSGLPSAVNHVRLNLNC